MAHRKGSSKRLGEERTGVVRGGGYAGGDASRAILDDGPAIVLGSEGAALQQTWSEAQAALFTKRGQLRKSAAGLFESGSADVGMGEHADSYPEPIRIEAVLGIRPSKREAEVGASEGTDGPTLKFEMERRRMPRREVRGEAMAVFASGRGAGTLARVQLVDVSWRGLGIRSAKPIEPGTSVSVIPEHAMSPRRIGIVVRCDAVEDGYCLGIQCRTQRAVA